VRQGPPARPRRGEDLSRNGARGRRLEARGPDGEGVPRPRLQRAGVEDLAEHGRLTGREADARTAGPGLPGRPFGCGAWPPGVSSRVAGALARPARGAGLRPRIACGSMDRARRSALTRSRPPLTRFADLARLDRAGEQIGVVARADERAARHALESERQRLVLPARELIRVHVLDHGQ